VSAYGEGTKRNFPSLLVHQLEVVGSNLLPYTNSAGTYRGEHWLGV
jgi:hypothetical protein